MSLRQRFRNWLAVRRLLRSLGKPYRIPADKFDFSLCQSEFGRYLHRELTGKSLNEVKMSSVWRRWYAAHPYKYTFFPRPDE